MDKRHPFEMLQIKILKSLLFFLDFCSSPHRSKDGRRKQDENSRKVKSYYHTEMQKKIKGQGSVNTGRST